MILELLIIFLVIYLWFISGREALSNLTRGRVRKLEIENKLLGQKAEEWFNNKNTYQIVFGIVLFFNISIISILVFSISFLTIESRGYTDLLSSFWYLPHIVIALIIAIILVILLETVARFFAVRYEVQTLRTIMPLIKFLQLGILHPLVVLIKLIRRKVQHPQFADEEDITTTEDEILSLLENDSGARPADSSLEEEEKQMIKGIFELNDTDVKEIMTPRVDVIALPAAASLEEATKLFIESGHSRIPIYHNTIDEISGIIFAKDFLDKENINGKTLVELSHKPIYMPETKQIGDLLNELKGSHNHFSVIIDEYGGTAGIVTLEDILEEIVGEIHDEYESEQEKTAFSFEEDGSIIMDARTLIDEVNEILKINLPEDEDVDTIGGYLCSQLGKIPEPGESAIVNDNLSIKVLEADKRRVMKLQIKLI